MDNEDLIIDELEAEPIQNNNPIEDLINHIQNKEYTDAEQAFNDVIGSRLQDTLDQAKVRIAGQVFNASEEPEDGDNDYDEETEEELSDYEFDDDIEEDDNDYLNDIG